MRYFLIYLFPLLLLASLNCKVHAAGYEYDVEIDAPSEAKSLLQAHLSLLRVRGQERTTAEQIIRLVDQTEEEARELLSTLGFFAPKIDVRYQASNGGTVVTVVVDPGKPIRVRQVNLKLTGPVLTSEKSASLNQTIQELWTLPADAVYTQAAWSDGKTKILRPLHDNAYAGANLKHSEAKVDIAAGTADLTLEIESGPAYLFGPLTIRGLKHYPEQLASEQAPFRTGDVYQHNSLVDLQTNLQRLPHFTLALVDTKLVDTPEHIVPVSVEIQEAPRHRIQTGLGYSSDTGLKGEAGYRYLNIAERGWISETKTSIAQDEQSIQTSLTFPPANADYEHRLYTGYVHTDIEGVDSRTWHHGIVREQGDFKMTRSWTLEYQTEQRELNSGLIENPRTLSLKYQWIRRKLDNPRDPQSGRLLQWEAGGALTTLLTNETYFRTYGRIVQYWSLGRNFVLQARAEAGETFARDETDVPTDWLFRTGGSTSVRGYDYQSLGVTKDGSISPGRVMAVGSLELQIPIYKQWRAAIFNDYGDAAERWGQYQGRTGTGAGIRWISPVGVLGIDGAYGHNPGQWRLHIALGLAF